MREERLYNISKSLHNSAEQALAAREEALAARAQRLELVSPVRVLARGYSVTQKDGHALRAANEANIGDTVTTLLHEGSITSVITEVTT